jgi:hypothetical protein
MALHLVVEISVSRRQAGAEGPMAEEGQTKCFLWSSPWNERRIMSNLSGPQVSQHSGDAADFVIARGRLLVAANLPRQVERDDVQRQGRERRQVIAPRAEISSLSHPPHPTSHTRSDRFGMALIAAPVAIILGHASPSGHGGSPSMWRLSGRPASR